MCYVPLSWHASLSKHVFVYLLLLALEANQLAQVCRGHVIVLLPVDVFQAVRGLFFLTVAKKEGGEKHGGKEKQPGKNPWRVGIIAVVAT